MCTKHVSCPTRQPCTLHVPCLTLVRSRPAHPASQVPGCHCTSRVSCAPGHALHTLCLSCQVATARPVSLAPGCAHTPRLTRKVATARSASLACQVRPCRPRASRTRLPLHILRLLRQVVPCNLRVMHQVATACPTSLACEVTHPAGRYNRSS
ncbi:hypothetical protein AMTR_s00075p00083670 [Amborella trichopoda]|uniref:Uncharacterized protein n=1 Tax=Amborella trichopoda TaxID=13333 RepID=W1PC17_AMBTC|nr:hypothetical protein AMTR_s00075p00083670 [Amborella trichopoda]